MMTCISAITVSFLHRTRIMTIVELIVQRTTDQQDGYPTSPTLMDNTQTPRSSVMLTTLCGFTENSNGFLDIDDDSSSNLT